MWLTNIAQSIGPILSSEPSSYFTIPLIVQYKSRSIKVNALLDSGASACLIDEDVMKCHKLPLVAKKCLVSVEVIDGRSFASGDVIHQIQPLDICLHGHHSTIIFNVIQSLSNLVILALSWLDRYNLQVDWSNQKVKFQSNNLKALDTQAIERLKNLECLKPEPHQIRTSKVQVSMTVGARTFMKVAKNGVVFAIYATPVTNPVQTTSELPA